MISFLKRHAVGSLHQRGPSAYFHASPTRSHMHVFDRALKKAQRDRAYAPEIAHESREVDYLRNEVAARLADRLLDIKRSFSNVLEVGSGCGLLYRHVDKDMMDTLVQCEMSEHMMRRDMRELDNLDNGVALSRVLADEEYLPFQPNTFDAVLSSMSLHWVNDLPGALQRIQKCLKPDGAFIGAMLGGETLYELRCSLQLAEIERRGGLAPRVSPFATPGDVTGLLNQAGLTLTTIDVDEIVVNYPSPVELMQDLQAMAENNAGRIRRQVLPKDVLMALLPIYQNMYGNADGTVPATFQVIYMIGWKPDSSQPKPLARGSATASFKDLDAHVSHLKNK